MRSEEAAAGAESTWACPTSALGPQIAPSHIAEGSLLTAQGARKDCSRPR